MAEIWPKMIKKRPKEKRDEAPISIDYIAHLARKIIENVT
jgi:hypothetical protein